MLKTLFSTIPKSVNEYLFAIGVLGLIILNIRRLNIMQAKKTDVQIITILTLTMIIWRIVYQIESRRYAIALIYPFSVFSGYFISLLLFSKRKLISYIAMAILICFCIYYSHNIYKSRSNNTNLMILAELHDRTRCSSERNSLFIKSEELFRLKQIEKYHNEFEVYDDDLSLQDIFHFIDSYTSIGKTTFLDFTMDSRKRDPFFFDKEKSRHVLSFFSQNNKKKRNHLIEIKTLPPQAVPILSPEDANAANSLAVFLTNHTIQSIDGILLDSPALYELAKEDSFFILRFQIKESGNPLFSQEVISLMFDKDHLCTAFSNGALKKGDRIKCNLVLFDELPQVVHKKYNVNLFDSSHTDLYYVTGFKKQ